MNHLFCLNEKNALVTGATGILGRHFCHGLAAFGARVAVVDLDNASCNDLASELNDTYKTNCIALACDISKETEVLNLKKEIIKAFGNLHILHNNAASKAGDLKVFYENNSTFSMDAWRKIMSVNLDGMFLMSRTFGEWMTQLKQGGSIIQTASIYGVVAPDQRIYEGSKYMGQSMRSPAAYSASKAGVIGLTKYLAALFGEHGVRVNALSPGGIESGQNDQFVQNYSKRVPLGRMGQAEEMIGTLIFLASDASKYLTGQNIIVDGGLSCW
ncbi:MAG: SDR family oxidoreductase [Bdellovibrionales bacterium]|nr:SDR family oxidoreductase [Bdellovibrionales bacterium]